MARAQSAARAASRLASKSTPRAGNANRVRIVGGEWRGRWVRFPTSAGLRPTPDRVRETLFNWLGQDLSGCRCLDLYAGSGVLGLEALSRGAIEVVMVERSRVVCRAIETAAATLGAHGLRLECADALEFAAAMARSGSGAKFDVVFLDPPYGEGLLAPTLARLPRLLAPGARVYFENDAPVDPGAGWRVLKQGRAGMVYFYLAEAHTDEHGDLPGDV